MDIRKTLEEITNIEKEKAQLELRQTQLTEKQDALAKRLADLGVSPAELDAEASRLETSIRDRLDAVRNGPAKTTTVKSKKTKSVDEDIISAIQEDK